MQPMSDAYMAYALQDISAADVGQRLETMLRGKAQVVVDRRANRVYVRGNPSAQRAAQDLIARLDKPPQGSQAPVAPPVRQASVPTAQLPTRQSAATGPTVGAPPLVQQPPAHTANAAARQEHRLQVTWQATDVEPALARLFGSLLQRAAPGQPGEPAYIVTAKSGQRTLLRCEPDRRAVAFSGPDPLRSQAIRLVAAHDAQNQATTGAVRAVPLRNSDPNTVQRAVDLYRRGNATRRPSGQPAAANQLAQAQPTPNQPLPNQPQATPADEGTDRTNEQLRELGLNLSIEVLPDLDAIILRGSDRDVNEVMRIIEDIERISAETIPEVEVVQLAHAGSDAVAALLTTVEPDLLAGRAGKVSVTPLNKPNALLLIGQTDVVKVVRDLITKLDRPVSPQSQLRVFRLRHAPATEAATTIQEFFDERPNLGTKLIISPDARTNSLIVHAAPRDMAEIELLVKRIDTEQSASVNVVRVFKLKNSLATNLAESLRAAVQPTTGGSGAAAAAKSSALELVTVDPQGQKVIKSGILSDVKITPDAKANSLIVTAPAQNMALVAALIEQMDDAAASVAQIKVFHIVNGDASSLVEMLRSLLPQQTGSAQAAAVPRAKDESSFVPLRYSVDVRTNSIIAAGSTGDLAIIEALLLRLDERDVEQRRTEVYQLKNAPALDVADAVNQFLRSQRQVQEAAPGELSPFQQIEKEVVVVPEPVGNLLIISASPRYFEEIYRMVETIDEQPPQVLIQVLIAEVALNEDTQFGIEWGVQDGLLFDRSLLGDLLTTTTTTTFGDPPTTVTDQNVISATQEPGFDFNSPLIGNAASDRSFATAAQTGKQALANFAVGRTDADLGFGGLVLSAGSKSINVLLRALQQNQRLEVLSRPQVMTIDNQPAFIQVGQKVPLITNVIVNQIGQTNTVQMDNVGLILGVTPRISPDGMVVMEVDAEKSDVAPESEGIPVSISASGDVVRAPRINITTAQTTVSTASGETIVLGGLITKRRLTVNRRVPYLSSVPVIGWMFRFDQYEARRTELLIILTPHVGRDAAEAERQRQVEAARMHWCAADVHEIHGDPALCRRGECPRCNSELPVIYPDLDPSGMSPNQILEMEPVLPGEPIEGPSMLPDPDDSSDNQQPPETKRWNLASLLPQRSVEKARPTTTDSARLPPVQPVITAAQPASPKVTR